MTTGDPPRCAIGSFDGGLGLRAGKVDQVRGFGVESRCGVGSVAGQVIRRPRRGTGVGRGSDSVLDIFA